VCVCAAQVIISIPFGLSIHSKGTMTSSKTESTGDIPSALAQLMGLVESKEKDLNKREKEFDRRLGLFEEKFPNAGKDSAVLHLNVGGSTNVAVLRRTLTHFEHSMLATRFSGRWDDSLEKDKDGNFFVDEDPEVFMMLLNFLRKCDKKKRTDLEVPAPQPTFEFCWMLEYYDLMLAVYPQEWMTLWGGEAAATRPSRPDEPYTLIAESVMCAFTLQLQRHGMTKPANVTGFTATFERGSTGQIGWTNSLANGTKVGYGTTVCSIALDLEERRILRTASVMTSGLVISPQQKPVVVKCTFQKSTNTYSIQVDGADPDIVASHISITKLYPHISLLGKVSISDICYDF
jgi:hypothetical protein